MTYFNPRIFNYQNLNKQDKIIVNWLIYLVESLENMEYDYSDDEDCTTLEKVKNEIAIETLHEAQDRLKSDIVDFMVSSIDEYEGVVNDVNTDDYFYGCPYVKKDV